MNGKALISPAIEAPLRDFVRDEMSGRKDDLARQVERALMAAIRSPEFEKTVRTTVLECAKDVTSEILASRLPEVDSRVRALVEQQFEIAVAQTAREQLESAIRDVRRKVSQ